MNTLSKNALSVLLCFSFVFASNAQVRSTRDSIIRAYEQRSIMLQNHSYVINGTEKRFGFFRENIKEELSSNPIALKEFQESQKSALIGLGLGLFALGMLIGGTRLAIQSQKEDRFILSLASLVPLILGLFYTQKSNNQFNRSVWIYNRDVLKD